MSADDLRALADRYLRLKQFQKETEETIQAVRAKLIASGKAEVMGDEARVTIEEAQRKWLDSDLVKAILTPKQVAECTKRKYLTVVKVRSLRKSGARYPDNG